MKICKTEKEFIDYVVPIAQKVCKRYGFKPSILIAQTALENGFAVPSNFDNSGIYDLMRYNCMVGQKADLLNDTWEGYSVWDGEKFKKLTPEEENGKKITIEDYFRKFESVEQSFCDYILFLLYAKDSVESTTYRYGSDVVKTKDPHELIKKVGKKYATDSLYADSVWRIVQKYNLTQYDDLSGVKQTDIIPPALQKSKSDITTDISINKQYITTNNTNSTNEPVNIVIHNTDNFNRGADALAHAKALYQGDIEGMSWHFAVDDHSIYKCVAYDRGAWHVGRNYGSDNLFGIVNNRNSIGIEMCVNAGYDYEKAFQNTVKLTKYLMKTLNIPASRVYTHQDICSKYCPSQILDRGDWGRFKQLISTTEPETTKSQTALSQDVFISTASRVCETARESGWTYGDSQTKIPCKDGKISCDRLIARTLWQCGFRDQRKGGETCGTLDEYLTSHGWTKVTNKDKIKAGAVVAVKNKKDSFINHVFVVKSYNKNKETCTKYDTGSQDRIDTEQPFKNVPLVEWKEREFVCAWNCPSYLAPGISDGRYLHDGIDYSPVFNKTYYAKLYPDLAKVYGTDRKKLFEHFLESGMREGRQACAEFCVHTYRDRYSDLKKAFGNDLTKYYAHYCTHGKDEGRIGN